MKIPTPNFGVSSCHVLLLVKAILVLKVKVADAAYSVLVNPYPIKLRHTFTIECSYKQVKDLLAIGTEVEFVESLRIEKVQTKDHTGRTLNLKAEANVDGPLPSRRILHKTPRRRITGDWRGVDNRTSRPTSRPRMPNRDLS